MVAVLRVEAPPRPIPAVVPVLGRTALWLPLVQRVAARYGVPEALELGLIAHESHGDYTAVGPDPNGTIDAGLTQINSGPPPSYPHWAEYGLSANPDEPAGNVAASLRILSADVARYGNVSAGLLAYNAGTPAGGLRWDPRYPGYVLGYARQIEAGPVIAAWPVGAGWTAGASGWDGPAPAAGRPTYVVVAAMGPSGRTERYAGATWAALARPQAVTVTVGATTYVARPSNRAPAGLRSAMPPSSAYWWAAVALPAGRAVAARATARWSAGPSPPRTVHASANLVLRSAAPRPVATARAS